MPTVVAVGFAPARSSRLPWLLWSAALVYLVAFPLQFKQSDEGIVLYGARRVLEGQALYKDFFEFITPGSFYLFAGLFAVTGPSLLAARVTMAAVNASSCALLFLLARRVAPVAEALAATLAFALACLPVWRCASPHWLSTFLCLAAGAAMLAERWAPHVRAAIVGALAGITFSVQQQRGVFLGLWAVPSIAVLSWAAPPSDGGRQWKRQVVWFVAAASAIVLAVLGYAAWRASLERLVYATYTFVFHSYRKPHATGVGWGGWFWMSAADVPYTWPWLLRWLPAVLVIETAFLAWRLRRQRTRAEAVRACLLLLGTSMAASVLYYPDFIHVSFIAPFLLIVAAGVAHEVQATTFLFRSRAAGAARLVLAAGVVLILLGKGWGNLRRAWDAAPERFASAVGTLHGGVGQRALLEAVQRAVEPGHGTVFSYPGDAWLYLAVPADNPTPYSLLLPRYNTTEQFDEALAALERRRADYLVILVALLPPGDPVMRYQQGRYERIVDLFPYAIFRRLDGAP